jgi:prolyl-tRNA synthetase
VKFDDRDTHKPGWKFAEYELKGVPVRLALGPRDIENNNVEITRRDTMEKKIVSQDNIEVLVEEMMNSIHDTIFEKADAFKKEHTTTVDTFDEFKQVLNEKGGLILAHWDGTTETELKIKEETQATIRCIPFDAPEEDGACVYTGKPSKKRVLFAKAY